MSLLDAVEPDTPTRDSVRSAATQRLAYLSGRAEWRVRNSEETSGTGGALPQRTRWAIASLWMEAIETALFIDDASTARAMLPNAMAALDGLGHPLGEALRQAFMPGRARRRDAREPTTSLFAPSARVWAGFSDRLRRDQPEREPQWENTRSPVGRMGVPVADVLLVARWRTPEPTTRIGEPSEAVTTVLQRLLDQQYTALAQARHNTHLWRRLLVPAPLFDLELAVLLAAGMTRHGTDFTPADMAAQRLPPEAKAFGKAYLEAVNKLKG